ncbi:MAG: NUDIX domain-containing protein [Pyrinomonadaceae bacterium]
MSILTKIQVSAGGVAFRQRGGKTFVALINVGADGGRWQLPKGLIEEDEAPEAAALREVHEETGIEATLVKLLDKVEYWYYSTEGGERIRFHKFVHFYLMRYKAGDVNEHDTEVNEARWVEISSALNMLAFKSEKQIVEQAQTIIKTIK